MTRHMLPRDAQLAIEHTYSRKFLDKYIDQEIRDNPEMEDKVQHGVALLDTYRQPTYHYEAKNTRVKQLQDIDLEQLVRDVFIGVAYCQTPELFTSITAQVAGRLYFDDKADSITTIAEIMAVLCQTDAFDIIKAERSASLVIQSRIPLSHQLIGYVIRSGYLPPMICEPEELHSNYESAYLTHNDCLVLGKANGHDGDLCLDVINKQNRIPLKLDLDFLSTVEETPTFALDSIDKLRNWNTFKQRSYDMYRLMAARGNRFYLTNKPDKRGRLYAQGYHITTQGTAFKKAMVEFADEEIVEGVPA